jgi:hypothetical protein
MSNQKPEQNAISASQVVALKLTVDEGRCFFVIFITTPDTDIKIMAPYVFTSSAMNT